MAAKRLCRKILRTVGKANTNVRGLIQWKGMEREVLEIFSRKKVSCRFTRFLLSRAGLEDEIALTDAANRAKLYSE